MSATRRRTASGKERQQTFFPVPVGRRKDQIDADVMRASDPGELPAEIRRTLERAADAVAGSKTELTRWDSFKESHLGLGLPRASRDTRRSREENEFIRELIERAVESGFWCALDRYAKHLRGSSEAMKFLQKRDAGGNKGRKTQQTKKTERIGRIHSMLNSGMEPAAIAADLKCSLATVYRALQPATSKPSKASTRTRKR